MEINGLPETFDGFKRLTDEEQRYAHYTVLRALSRCIDDHQSRLEKIEKRKWVNTGAAAAGGLLGGFLAIVSALKFRLFTGG